MAIADGFPNPDFSPALAPDVVNFTIDAIHDHDGEAGLRLTQAEWDALAGKPNVRRYIAAMAFELAPDNIEAREDITRRMLGIFVVEHETELTNSLEAQLALTAN